jgi:hypothetical protein
VSIISDIYDAYITQIQASLPDYARIPNGLDAQNAVSLFKKKGFSFSQGTAENSERLVGCKASVRRQFILSIFQKMYATENNTTAIDAIIKDMLETTVTLIKDIENSNTLNSVTLNVGKTKYLGDQGVVFITGEREKFLQLDINFETEYFIDLTN